MQINRLFLQNFRNYEMQDISFRPGVNIFYGDNAQGKTNLLEALWLFTAAKSFRTQKDSEMIRFGAKEAKVLAEFSAFGRETNAEITLYSEKRKLLRLGGAPLTKTSELLGQFPAVLFSPDELHIITGAPEVRRRFMDSAISAARPAYYGALRNYMRSWKQKNMLLKSEPKKEDLTVWNMQMAQSGALLMQYRKNFFEKLAPLSEEMHKKVAGKAEILSVQYAPSVKTADSKEEQEEILFAALEKKREAEIYQGLSLLGPHRDEIRFFINDLDARAFASQGQMRTAAVSLKIAQGMLLEAETGEEPCIFLDDILGELDIKRRTFLLESMENKQIFLTCTEKNGVESHRDCTYFEVSGGKICIST